MEGRPFLEMRGISKQFPGVKALDKVDLSVFPGEVHALVGENGAGKSTIIKIIMGVYQKDEGSVLLDGRETDIPNVIEAGKMGLAAVYQDLTLAHDLSIGENFFMGQFPRKKNGLIDWDYVFTKTEETLKTLNVDVNPKLKITELSPAMQEMVAIAKTVHKKAKLIIFDEPTALLSNEEVEILFDIIRKLKENGISVIYISHRLEEIFTICDNVSVLKDGKHVKTLPVAQTNQDELISLMVGRDLTDMYNIDHFPKGEELLKVENLNRAKVLKDISFSVKQGEIFGLFGLVGSGRTEVVRAIYGADAIDGGQVFFKGNRVQIKHPSEAIALGIGLLPEDRKHQGLALNQTINHNINLASYKAISKFSFVMGNKERARSEDFVQRLHIKTPSIHQLVRNLSGGNQQKVIIAKWLCCESKLFIFDEPTVGIDVGAKQEIYKLIEELTKAGHAVILISSYLPEVMGLSDRIGVLHEGSMSHIVEREDFKEEALLRYASGL
ncbi:MAG: sugar ABC transporter ATP-binding protein [Erysipelotrichaceae bacterium]|nr:sugar ABC transporter ATP-binding protein [Erysipelotrichaceae bacterium]MDD3523084.1 sugar ABC transporter ATP-binding protein [Candidatus Cloacimonadota bacterium]